MSLESILAQNRRDLAAGIRRVYPEHADKEPKIGLQPAHQLKVVTLPCVHVGPDSGPKGWHYCDHPDTDNTRIPAGDVVCGTGCNGKCNTRCPGYTPTTPHPNIVAIDQNVRRSIRLSGRTAGTVMKRVKPITWAYGVTTVPSRRTTTLPVTLKSLQAAGFPTPHLFIDGDHDGKSWQEQFGLNVTCHGGSPIRAYGNWTLGLAELYIRNPTATYFAMFQDDFITYKNLRTYLEKTTWPSQSYLNLYTIPQNTAAELKRYGLPAPPDNYVGLYESNQRGRGAVALVFRHDAVLMLLTHQHMVERPLDPKRGHKSIDGGVVSAMVKCNWKEMVHYPSLTHHIGKVSAIGNRPQVDGVGFLGEEYDALDLLKVGHV